MRKSHSESAKRKCDTGAIDDDLKNIHIRIDAFAGATDRHPADYYKQRIYEVPKKGDVIVINEVKSEYWKAPPNDMWYKQCRDKRYYRALCKVMDDSNPRMISVKVKTSYGERMNVLAKKNFWLGFYQYVCVKESLFEQNINYENLDLKSNIVVNGMIENGEQKLLKVVYTR